MKPASPQLWPSVLSGSGGAPTPSCARNRDLLVPGVEAVGLHADGDVEIEADLHAEPVRELLAGAQLAVGDPLHELDEFDLAPVGAGAELRALRLVRLPPFLRPFPPWRLEFLPHHLEAGEMRQQRAALGAEGIEILRCGQRLASALNFSKAERNARHFSAATPG